MRFSDQVRSKAVCHPRVADGLLALLLFGLAVTISFKGDLEHPASTSATSLIGQALIFSALCWRRVAPRAVLAVTTLGAAGLIWYLDGAGSPVVLAPCVAMVLIGFHGDRRTTVAWWAGASAVLIAGGTLGTGGFEAGQISTLVWLGFFAAAGEAVASKQAYVAAIEERVLRAEHTREEEARRRVAEERLRIAQELHDVVAHHIAVIHVQASVAEHMVTDRPKEAAEALTHVRRSSRVVLDELTGLLNVLRQPGDSKTPVEPAAGVDDLPSLIHSFESSGLRVSWTIRGHRRPLPPAVDLVAYRLVQEGLTNAHKHGSGSAVLDVRFTGATVMIDIVNAGGVVAEPAAPGQAEGPLLGGYGLMGMRERALAVGGSLRAAPEPDGTWRVRAQLPVRPEEKPEEKAAAPEPEPQPEPQPDPVPATAAGCAVDVLHLPARLTANLAAGREISREINRGAAPESA